MRATLDCQFLSLELDHLVNLPNLSLGRLTLFSCEHYLGDNDVEKFFHHCGDTDMISELFDCRTMFLLIFFRHEIFQNQNPFQIMIAVSGFSQVKTISGVSLFHTP